MNSLYSAEGYWRCEVCEERVCWEGMGVQGQQQVPSVIYHHKTTRFI